MDGTRRAVRSGPSPLGGSELPSAVSHSTGRPEIATYKSVDALQLALAGSVFERTKAPKKAAGRALGTLVELITFYLIRDWGLEPNLAIERGLREYGNSLITHNVEFTLHPHLDVITTPLASDGKTLTATQVIKQNDLELTGLERKGGQPLLRGSIVRHANLVGEAEGSAWYAYLAEDDRYSVTQLFDPPFAMFECKRVGVEEGQKKGPQTIEKAKQGAYVARTVSGLQRVPRRDGSVAALVEEADGRLTTHPDYYLFIREAIDSGNLVALANVVLTVGVVSNHGNWFTADTQNKEMRVLAQSYDWLLFLTDDALAEFIETILLGDSDDFAATRSAFEHSYSGDAKSTSFTKVSIDVDADRELTKYFKEAQPWAKWFNVIAPGAELDGLQHDLQRLRDIREEVLK
ncbi:MAG TPA: hypothetical protein PL091_08030 [Actinomycetota bacterium]|nr:hypothetical protein [Microthrixaceae bacterium]HPE12434.1 hypothetical protein [Actinomycetota bacterium]